MNLINRVGESNKTFVLSHHLSRIMYYPEKQVFTIENQVKFGIIFYLSEYSFFKSSSSSKS